jgi:hypothetical protein
VSFTALPVLFTLFGRDKYSDFQKSVCKELIRHLNEEGNTVDWTQLAYIAVAVLRVSEAGGSLLNHLPCCDRTEQCVFVENLRNGKLCGICTVLQILLG